VSNLKDLTTIIIPHFDKYTLLNQKGADFLLFKQVIELIKKKAHLYFEGLQQIINIKASMNLGLSEVQKSNFINFTPVDRPLIITTKISDPHWIAGFFSGKVVFLLILLKAKQLKLHIKLN
jgi:hypothetical protein